MNVNGIEFDDPRDTPLLRGDFSLLKEGGRTSGREIWVSSYTKDDNVVVRSQHRITMTNRGACAIDDRPVRDEDGKKQITAVMEAIFKNGRT